MIEQPQEILIVEDSPVEAELLRRTLVRAGYQVRIAHNGAEGVEAARSKRPAMVMSDINMPVMDGYQLCRILKYDEELWNLPLVLLTVLSEPEDIIQAISAGADAYIVKPFIEATLLERISSLLNQTIKRRRSQERRQELVEYGGKQHTVLGGGQQIINMLFSLYENILSQNRELSATQLQLNQLNESLDRQVRERTLALQASEARLRTIIETTSDWLWETDPQGVYTYASPRVFDLLGYLPAEVIGKTPFDFMPPQEAVKIAKRFESLAANSASFHLLENLNLHRDGRSVVLESSGIPILARDGGLRGYRGVNRDVTERKKREEELFASNQINQVTFDRAPIGVGHVDLDGRWLRVNDRLCEIVGYPRQELLELSFQDITYPEDLETDLEYVRQLIAGTRNTYSMEKRYRRKEGSLQWVRLTVSLVRDANGEPRHFISLIEDISADKAREEEEHLYQQRLEREVRQRTAELQAVNDNLQSFSYSISHDLRSPLRAIDGFIDMLLEDHAASLNAEGLRLFGVVRDNARKLNQLIGNILDFSRAGRLELDCTLLDMRALVKEVWNGLEAQRGEREIELNLEELPQCYGDIRAIRQVWQNLLSNAIKFTGDRHPALIKVSATQSEGFIWYQVTDNGAGFNPEQAHKLFSLFQRLHSADQFEGTGAGLAIVKNYIHKHGGKVEAQAVQGEGATFGFALPEVLPS